MTIYEKKSKQKIRIQGVPILQLSFVNNRACTVEAEGQYRS